MGCEAENVPHLHCVNSEIALDGRESKRLGGGVSGDEKADEKFGFS